MAACCPLRSHVSLPAIVPLRKESFSPEKHAKGKNRGEVWRRLWEDSQRSATKLVSSRKADKEEEGQKSKHSVIVLPGILKSITKDYVRDNIQNPLNIKDGKDAIAVEGPSVHPPVPDLHKFHEVRSIYYSALRGEKSF